MGRWPGALYTRVDGDETMVRREQVGAGEGARDDAADEEAVVASSDSGE